MVKKEVNRTLSLSSNFACDWKTGPRRRSPNSFVGSTGCLLEFRFRSFVSMITFTVPVRFPLRALWITKRRPVFRRDLSGHRAMQNVSARNPAIYNGRYLRNAKRTYLAWQTRNSQSEASGKAAREISHDSVESSSVVASTRCNLRATSQRKRWPKPTRQQKGLLITGNRAGVGSRSRRWGYGT